MSDVGFRRRNNQDACMVHMCSEERTWTKFGHLLMVADGMGGHAVGELASKLCVDTVPHTFFKTKGLLTTDALKQAIETANRVINERGNVNHDFQRMGTTCTALVLSPRGAIMGHVGDSRGYRIRGDRIDQLTFDHSLQWEVARQRKLKLDEVVMQEPRNVITRSLGPEEQVEVDVEGPFPVLPGDTYVLCSDGVTVHLNDEEIGAIARELPPEDACRLLLNLTNTRGGTDNATLVIARVGALPKDAPPIVIEQEPEPESAAHQWWVLAFWAAAFTLICGFVLTVLRWNTVGLTISSFGALGVIAILVFWFRARKQEIAAAKEEPSRDSQDRTTVWRPYRTAPAKLTGKLVSYIAAVAAELQRTGIEEEWDVDWKKHEDSFKKARESLAAQQFGVALRHYASVIDVLMLGLQQYRKSAKSTQKNRTETPRAPADRPN